MRAKRLYHSIRLLLCRTAIKRAAYLKKHNILGAMGDNCRWGPWRLPLYPKLIRLHNNVSVHKNARIVTHDMLNNHLKRVYPDKDFGSKERVGCIELMDNVYIASQVYIIRDVRINKNCIITAHSVVTSDIPENTIAAGNPAKPIGKFELFVALRSMSKGQSEQFMNQELPDEVAEVIWEKFYKKRDKG